MQGGEAPRQCEQKSTAPVLVAVLAVLLLGLGTEVFAWGSAMQASVPRQPPPVAVPPRAEATPEAQTGSVRRGSGTASLFRLHATGVVLPVVMYHYVEPDENPKDVLRVRLDTPPDAFEGQLRYFLGRGYRTIFVSDIPRLLAGSGAQRLPQAVALTFDDGYEDFYANVFPLLRKHSAKATLYVIAGFVGRSGYVTAEQLREMLGSGLVEIGSHTVTHPDLRHVSDAELKRQIAGSKLLLEDLLGVAIHTFAYPSGKYDPRALALVRQAGYTAAVTTRGGVLQSRQGIYALRRIRAERTMTDILRSFGL